MTTAKNPATRRYVVVGCGGFIGAHLVERLLGRADVEVEGWDAQDHRLGHLSGRSRLTLHKRMLREPARDPAFVDAVAKADAVIHLAAICNPAEYTARPIDVIAANFTDTAPLVPLCAETGSWLVYFSTSEVYGRTLASYMPEKSRYEDRSLFELSEEHTPLLMGPIQNQRWTYACAKQLMERWIYAHHKERSMPFTIVRPLNFFGAGMDYLPGIEGDGTPRVLASFAAALLTGAPLKLVDGGGARRTIVYIDDAMDALMAMLDLPERAQNTIFNIGSRENEVSMQELAVRMRRIWAEVSGDERELDHPIVCVPATEVYGEGYEDCDRRMPSVENCRDRLGWEATTPLDEILRRALTDYYRRYRSRDGAEPASQLIRSQAAEIDRLD